MDKMTLMKQIPEDVYKLTSEEEGVLKNYAEGQHKDVTVYWCPKHGNFAGPFILDETVTCKCPYCKAQCKFVSPGILIWNRKEYDEFKAAEKRKQQEVV